MTNIINALKLDFYVVKSSYRMAALTYLISIFFGFAVQPAVPIFIIMVFTVFYCGMIFSIYEKNHLNKLYGVLPLNRSDVVTGRYVYAFLFGLIQAVMAEIISCAISYTRNIPIDTSTNIAALVLAFLYFCFAVGVAFPIYFKFGFSKAYVFTMLPMYLIFIGGFFISKKTTLLNNVEGIIQYFSAHQSMVLILGFGLGVVMLAISCVLSNFIYRKSEL